MNPLIRKSRICRFVPPPVGHVHIWKLMHCRTEMGLH